MAASSPSLSLSDIMHTFSPPPTAIPPKSNSPPPRPRSSTPEPLELAEIEEMRRKVISMGLCQSSKGKEKAGTRDQELADMLMRLTHPASLPQPSQLHAQAETIAHLIQQRDFLVQRSMEEHERWESEREGWARAAQALIIQGRREMVQAERDDAAAAQYSLVTADASTQRMQEFEHANVTLQNEKKMLQQKLTDTQNRLATLESELAQLKPLLLMQPYALTHSHPTGTSRSWSAALPNPGTPPTIRRRKNQRQLHDEEDAEGDEPDDDEELHLPQLQPRPQFRNPVLRPITHDPPLLPPSFPISPNKSKGDYYRRRDAPASTVHYPFAQYSKPRRKASSSQGSSSKTTLSDARAEHLLLAARKIGKQRAAILSGAFAHIQQPLEPPSYYKKTPSSPSKTTPQPPKTPRRGANANTPLLTRTPLGQPGTSITQPRTPLQSLLSAAQSVLSGPDAASSPGAAPDSPLAKRRKTDHTTMVIPSVDTPQTGRREKEKNREKAPLSGVARVKSALDFLADQAEVYSTQPPGQFSVEDGDGQPVDGEEPSAFDVEMEDASQLTENTDANGRLRRGRSSQLIAPDASLEQEQSQQPDVDDTQKQDMTRGITPAASLGAFSDPSQTEPISLQPPRSHQDFSYPDSAISEALGAPLTLAPPIDLTPRASRSPGVLPASAGTPLHPQHETEPPSLQIRQSRALSAPAAEPASGSFSMFALQQPQTAVPTSGGDPSVLDVSAGDDLLESDQGLSAVASSRLVESIKFISENPTRRTRSPYIKWTKEEDDLLAKAVAKYGQKWDLVQKALPSRGYHQVRQRWLRKLGVFDSSKLDLSSLETNAAADFLNISTATPTDADGLSLSEPHLAANPKLGLAPLNSEKSLTALSSPTDGIALPSSPFPTNVLAMGRSSSLPACGTGQEG